MKNDRLWSAFFICLAGFVTGLLSGEFLFDLGWKCTKTEDISKNIPEHCQMYDINGACIVYAKRETVIDEICVEKERIQNE